MSFTSFMVLSVIILNLVSLGVTFEVFMLNVVMLGVTFEVFMLNVVMLFVTSAFYQSIYFKCGYYGCFILDWQSGYCYAE